MSRYSHGSVETEESAKLSVLCSSQANRDFRSITPTVIATQACCYALPICRL